VVAGRHINNRRQAILFCLALAFAVGGCRDEPTAGLSPYALEGSHTIPPGVTVGTEVVPAPTFVVRNLDGQPLGNLPVRITITAGAGTLREVPARTEAGPTPIGRWTLDTIVGVNEVTISAGDAPPLTIRLTSVAGRPASISTVQPLLDGPAGGMVAQPAALVVKDRYGNPVAGVDVSLSVAEGGGVVTPATLTSDRRGVLGGFSWQLGRLGGTQRLVVTAGTVLSDVFADIRSSFSPSVRFVGAPPSAAVQAAFRAAADRLRASIVGDLSDVPVLNFDLSRCGFEGATITETVDDLVIVARVTAIDGVGQVLASAGQCITRTQSGFPVIGVMRFDADDIAGLESTGRLEAVVLHEMLHVIGIGTMWRSRDLLFGAGTGDPRFAGLMASAQCQAAGGISSCIDGRVPVENTGGPGTGDVHWREAVFDREVMTGFVETDPDMPLSAVSIASLADLGYTINLLSSDPFVITPLDGVSPRVIPRPAAPWETIIPAPFEVTPAGWVRPRPIR
jgi:hypothetical protein